MAPENFHYLNVSRSYDADGIDDKDEYKDMRKAMNVCSINNNDQQSIMQILAGVLHLGNIEFVEEGNNAIVKDHDALAFPAYLLYIPPHCPYFTTQFVAATVVVVVVVDVEALEVVVIVEVVAVDRALEVVVVVAVVVVGALEVVVVVVVVGALEVVVVVVVVVGVLEVVEVGNTVVVVVSFTEVVAVVVVLKIKINNITF
ncbi:Unconventional myosin-If [Nowakowskiella sp. JEL0078]|nr:Unconventional myosin-If [Nowakowskiella sp. JEL0078]